MERKREERLGEDHANMYLHLSENLNAYANIGACIFYLSRDSASLIFSAAPDMLDTTASVQFS